MASPVKMLAVLMLVSALAVPAFATHQLFHFGSMPDNGGMFNSIFVFPGRNLFDNSGPGSFNRGDNIFGRVFFFDDDRRFVIFPDRPFFVFDRDDNMFDRFFVFDNRPFVVFGDVRRNRGVFEDFDDFFEDFDDIFD